MSSRSSGARAAAVALSAAVALAAGAWGAPAKPSPQPDAWALHEGALLAPRDGLVYLMTPDGAIDAVDVAAGSVAWRTIEAAKPLALSGHLLVAQGEPGPNGELRLVVLDTTRPGGPLSLADVPLPGEVRALVGDGLGESFRALAAIHEGDVLVSWNAEIRPRSGISPSVPDPTEAPIVDGAAKDAQAGVRAIRSFQGTVQLDLATGGARATAPVKSAVAVGPALTELDGAARLDGAAGRQFLSVDGRHVLASERNAEGDADSRFRWTVWARSTGERLGGFDSRVSATPFLVSETIALFVTSPRRIRKDGAWSEEPLTIRAVELATGVEIWSRELRDTKYRGPLPP